jgi:hypothetical protein
MIEAFTCTLFQLSSQACKPFKKHHKPTERHSRALKSLKYPSKPCQHRRSPTAMSCQTQLIGGIVIGVLTVIVPETTYFCIKRFCCKKRNKNQQFELGAARGDHPLIPSRAPRTREDDYGGMENVHPAYRKDYPQQPPPQQYPQAPQPTYAPPAVPFGTDPHAYISPAGTRRFTEHV